MENPEAILLTREIFDLISNADSIAVLMSIEEHTALAKFKMNTDKYSKINFRLDASDIEKLIERKILTKSDYSIQSDTFSEEADPMAKLLYALAWKNGDLGKLKHIIKGIVDSKNPENAQEDALVFYQFGKYLTKTTGEPIIDQHVIRAHAAFEALPDEVKFTNLRELDTLSKKQASLIASYKNWLKEQLGNISSGNPDEYAYYIDRILFATGKAIKKKGKSI